jgi:hypothetical protein
MANQKYARLHAGVVEETFTPPADFKIGDCFHPDIASQFTPCDPEVTPGYTLDNGTWKPPINTQGQ